MSLEPLLKKHISRLGPMSMHDYISFALYHPNYGYYKTKEAIGSKGDFITSPEISQTFGEMVALFFIDYHHKDTQNKDKDIHFVEMGAGKGTALSDMLNIFQQHPSFFDKLHIHIIETNPVLREKQEEAMERYKKPITFHNDIHSLPNDYSYIFANEFFDALPIRQFIKQDSQWHEIMVGVNDNDHLCLHYAQTVQSNIVNLNPDLKACEDKSIFEYSPQRETYCQIICEIIKQHGGVALLIDYGFFNPKYQNTLHAIKNHQKQSVLYEPGQTDLSSHVDFEVLKKIAIEHNLTVSGPTTQGEWLKALGIETRQKQIDISYQDIKRLISKEEMGDLFKVMAIHDKNVSDLEGF